MRILLKTLLSVVALLAAGIVSGSAARAGAGTFTRITTPGGASFTFQYDGTKAPAQNTFTVSGQASLDVTSVDIDCVYTSTMDGLTVASLATGVPVSGGAFSGTAAYPQQGILNCRLRAVPTGVDPTTSYLGSYAGPILYTSGILKVFSSGKLVTYGVISERGDATAILEDAGDCGPALIGTVTAPAMITGASGSPRCAFALSASNVASGGTATGSTIKVDGHNAYLPAGVATYLISQRGLTVTRTGIGLTRTTAANGDVHVTETSALVRCSGTNPDTYPPTGSSCTSLVSAGVTFTRVTDIVQGSHQMRIRDVFASTGAQAHALTLQYQGQFHPPSTGATGYAFPGHGFTTAAPDQVITGLGTRAGSALVRSDIYAVSDDPSADTLALTWSRAPSGIRFDHSTPGYFGMNYALSVPASGQARIGFAYSERLRTSDVGVLAKVAVAEMINAPAISSPVNGAVIKGRKTTVKGYVTAGANGVPTRVLVNGHRAALTKVSLTKSTYRVSFNEAYGRHRITVTAYDAAGNARSRAISVRNKAA